MSWPMVPLGDLGQWFGGGTPSKSRLDFWTAGSIPWISPKDMGPEVIAAARDLIAPVAVEESFNQDMKAILPSPEVDARWIAWGLRARERQLLRECRKAGTTVASIEWPRFRSFRLPVPPLGEQRRIIEILEGNLSRLQAASTHVSKAMRRADALVASSLARHMEMAAGGEGFRWSTVGAEAVLIEYGTSAKCTIRQEDTDVPVIRMGNLKGGELDWGNLKYLPAAHEHFPKLLLVRGDLLFNRTNSAELVGKAAVFDGPTPASFASYLIRVRFKDSVDPGWANMVINSPAGRRYVSSVVSQQVGQANVNGTKLKAFPLPLPGRDEQKRRGAEHGDVLAARERLRSEAGALLSRSESLRRSLLTAAFSGRLTGDRQHLDTEELVIL